MRALARFFVVALLATRLEAQTPVFQLQIPELGDKIFDADVVEIPGRIPDALLLRVLNPVAAEVDYGKIQTKLNGEGAGYITSVNAGPDGKIARMDLKLRAGMQLTEGTNSVEIQATNRHGRKFYRNFLIRIREHERNGYFIYEASHAAGDKTGGPNVLITQPEGPVVLGTKERTRSVLVKGGISSVSPVTGFQVQGKASPAAGNVFDFAQTVQVGPTDTKIVVEAIDQAGNRAAVTIPVSHAGAGKALRIEGERYALLIGISQYGAKLGLPGLATAAVDARDFGASLTGQGGFKKENVMILTDEAATQAQMLSALRTFTARPGPDDLLVVFVAGYGLHDPLDPSKLYLAAYDTQLGHVPQTALSVDDLKSTLGASVRSRQALFLFDVEHPVTGDWASAGNNLINGYLLRLFAGDAGKAVMVGSSVGENSVEAAGGGLFARQLIDAARGAGDADQDGAITVREWFLHVSNGVRKQSNGAQNPRFTLQQAEKPVFAMAH